MAQPTQPLISVLMPVYNGERYLRVAIESVLAQTFRDFEVIVVNDGSSDGSQDIIDEYACIDERIRIVSRPNTGIVGARNDGLALSRGQFIACVDADDVAHPERLARQLRVMQARPEIVCVGCRCLIVDDDCDPFNFWGRDSEHKEIEASLLKGIVSALVQSSVMYRRSEIMSINGYRGDVGASEELDLYLRFAERGQLANLPEVLMTIRRHPDSFSANRSSEHQADTRKRCVTEALNRRGQDDADATAYFPSVSLAAYDAYRRRAMQAIKNGFAYTARKYARRAFRVSPWRRETWKLLLVTHTCRNVNSPATIWWDLQRSKHK